MEEERFRVRVKIKRHEDDHGVLKPYVTFVNPPCQRNDELLFESKSKERAVSVFMKILRIQEEAEASIKAVLKSSWDKEATHYRVLNANGLKYLAKLNSRNKENRELRRRVFMQDSKKSQSDPS